MGKNRVDHEYVEAFAKFADAHWADLIGEAQTAFSQPKPKPTDRDYWKSLTFQHNAKQRLLTTIKIMAQAKSGAIHPTGQNTVAERAAAAEWITRAKTQLGLPTTADLEVPDDE